ncbi:MAG: sugar ABC transporter permease [Clostridiales bacterium]|nr:sugar ABC transporter permease [Clostridiales bacterium]
MLSKSATQRKAFWKSVLFVLPGVAITVIFAIYPVINTFWLSLNDWNGVGGSAVTWVGLANYVKTLTSSKFWNSMLNALYFMIGGFVVLMPIAFGMALLVTSKMKGTKFFKASYLMPVMLGTTAVGLMWKFMLNSDFGVLAQFLNAIGMGDSVINWLATPTVNIWCIVLVNEWMYAGYNMLIFAAGIVAIPDEIHDAALLDGCTGMSKIIHIVFPLCKNMFMVFSVLCVTGCLKAFDIVWSMTGGGPMDTSATPAILLYTQGFQYKLMGRSAAIGMILLVLGLVLSLLLNNVIFKQEDM